jgi:hypothetical protein
MVSIKRGELERLAAVPVGFKVFLAKLEVPTL